MTKVMVCHSQDDGSLYKKTEQAGGIFLLALKKRIAMLGVAYGEGHAAGNCRQPLGTEGGPR